MNVEKGLKGFKSRQVEERFWEKVDTSAGANECWPWKGACSSAGYGQIYFNGRNVRATRLSWELHNGKPFPKDKHACHSCDNPGCVNPRHIWPGTMSENIRDAVSKGRLTNKGVDRSKKYCKNGHPLRAEGAVIVQSGRKKCVKCRQDRAKNRVEATGEKKARRGEHNGNSKLTREAVEYIRENYKRTSYIKSNKNELAEKFGINQATVMKIVNKQIWKD